MIIYSNNLHSPKYLTLNFLFAYASMKKQVKNKDERLYQIVLQIALFHLKIIFAYPFSFTKKRPSQNAIPQ